MDVVKEIEQMKKEKESDLNYIKQKIDEVVKTPAEDVRSDIIAAIKEQEQESHESQKTIRHYLVLSYATKIGLGIIGWLKLQVIMPVISEIIEFIFPFF